MPKQIFISHAKDDHELAEEISDLFSTGMGINAEKDIFCTSLEGQGIPSGKNFVQYIKDEIKGCKVIILLLTKNYFASHFCLAELGASWVIADQCTHENDEEVIVIPIVVNPVSRSELDSVLTGIHARKIEVSSDWGEISEEMKRALNIEFSGPKWDSKRTKALIRIKRLVKKKTYSTPIPAAEHDKLKKLHTETQDEVSELEEQLEEKDDFIKKLEDAKDSVEVRQIKVDNMDEHEAFTSLGSELKHRLSDLPYIMDSAIFHHQRGEDLPEPVFGYTDTDDKWKDIHEAEKKKMLQGEPPLSVNDEHPKIRKVLAALENLVTHMNEHESTLRPILEEKYECTYDLGDEDFWYNATNY